MPARQRIGQLRGDGHGERRGLAGRGGGTLAVGKASQTIAAFMPTNGSWFAQDAMVGLSATPPAACRELRDNGGPGVITSGTNLSFTSIASFHTCHPDRDANWLTSPPVTNTFRVLGYFTLEIVSAYGMTAPPWACTRTLRERADQQVHAPDTRGTTQYQCRGLDRDGEPGPERRGRDAGGGNGEGGGRN
jgi:hypothetical protein